MIEVVFAASPSVKVEVADWDDESILAAWNSIGSPGDTSFDVYEDGEWVAGGDWDA